MFIKLLPRNRSAYTLVEALIATTLFTTGIIALCTICWFYTQSFTSLSNYSILDQYNRQAMDKFTSELRQAQQLTDYSSNATSSSITFLSGDTGQPITYTFDATKQQVRREDSAGSRVMLTNCSVLHFTLGLRPPPPPTNGTFDFYPAAIGAGTNWQSNVKVVQLSWKTAMTINPTPRITSEDIQTACVVIRKQRNFVIPAQ
jgi:hypothetical protein